MFPAVRFSLNRVISSWAFKYTFNASLCFSISWIRRLSYTFTHHTQPIPISPLSHLNYHTQYLLPSYESVHSTPPQFPFHASDNVQLPFGSLHPGIDLHSVILTFISILPTNTSIRSFCNSSRRVLSEARTSLLI